MSKAYIVKMLHAQGGSIDLFSTELQQTASSFCYSFQQDINRVDKTVCDDEDLRHARIEDIITSLRRQFIFNVYPADLIDAAHGCIRFDYYEVPSL